jgi:hypothetical protein
MNRHLDPEGRVILLHAPTSQSEPPGPDDSDPFPPGASMRQPFVPPPVDLVEQRLAA